MRKDLRSRITDEQPGVARQGAAQRIRSFPAPLARTLRCSNAEGMGRGLRGIEGPNATRCATHSDRTAQKRRDLANYPPRFTDKESVFVDSLVIAVNLLGDWLRDALNPKLR
jgi:hypothetical protein